MAPSTSKKILEPIEILSRRSGIPIAGEIQTYELIKTKERLLPYAFVKKNCLIPLKKEENLLYIAVADPFDLSAIEEVRHMTHSDVVELLLPRNLIEKAIEKIYQQSDDEASEYIQGLDDKSVLSLKKDQEYDLLEQEADSAVIKALNMIIVEALSQEASDIHFEPMERGLIVRYRVDGMLQIKHTLPPEMVSPLITRIKVLAELDIAEQRLPQDGRIKLRMGGREIDFRISTIPVVFGERVVLRILDRSQLMVGFEFMGMRGAVLEKFKRDIQKTQGMILVTGPTGSGKSTTLYSALSEIISPEINIMTIEDPVEYKIEGMAQISVNSKINLNFARGLRHILRQDPDVVMIGEIRDSETADIAVQAALTGHLVLSTLHTNDAASAIARLVDMGVEPYLLSSSLICVLAQRLVRTLCKECKIEYKISKEELTSRNIVLPERAYHQGQAHVCKAQGCESCFHTGYKGRVGIYELMEITPRIKKQISQSAESTQINEIAKSEGMKSLASEAIDLVLNGQTSIDEIIRILSSIGGS